MRASWFNASILFSIIINKSKNKMKTTMTILLMLIAFAGNAQWATFTPIQSGQPSQSNSTVSTSRTTGYELDNNGYVSTKYSFKVSVISRGNTETYRITEYKELGNSYAAWNNCNQDAYEVGNVSFSRAEEIASKSFTYYIYVMGNKVYFNP
jgi:hypothetical protein